MRSIRCQNTGNAPLGAPTLARAPDSPSLSWFCRGASQRRQCVMQFGWLKENIKALPYWIWQHVQIRISPATLFYWLGWRGSRHWLPPPRSPPMQSPRLPSCPVLSSLRDKPWQEDVLGDLFRPPLWLHDFSLRLSNLGHNKWGTGIGERH